MRALELEVLDGNCCAIFNWCSSDELLGRSAGEMAVTNTSTDGDSFAKDELG